MNVFITYYAPKLPTTLTFHTLLPAPYKQAPALLISNHTQKHVGFTYIQSVGLP